MTDVAASPKRVLCLCGSMRRVSVNRAALEAARELAPASLRLEIYPGMGALPWFSPDTEIDPLPQPVLDLRAAIGRADALLIGCPEYAHGIPARSRTCWTGWSARWSSPASQCCCSTLRREVRTTRKMRCRKC